MDEFIKQYFFYLIIPFWFVSGYIGAYFSGWMMLARVYKKDPDKHSNGKTQLLSLFGSGLLNYGNCVFISADVDGLYLSMIFFFRAGYDSLFIPWSDITISRGTYFIFFDTINFVFKGNPGTVYYVYENQAKEAGIFEHLKVK
jgi:hypothetical protein